MACISLTHQNRPKDHLPVPLAAARKSVGKQTLHRRGLVVSAYNYSIGVYCAVQSRALARNDSLETAVEIREEKNLVICLGQLIGTRTTRRSLITTIPGAQKSCPQKAKTKGRDCLRFRKVSDKKTKMAERKLTEEALGLLRNTLRPP